MSLNSEKTSLSKLFDPSNKIPDFDIDDVTRDALCFREDLIVNSKEESTSETKPVGGYCISIESIGTEGKEFMIQVLSTLSVSDSYAGSKVLSSTTAKLHCLEEKRTEYIHREDGPREKVLYMGLEDDIYHLEGEDLCPCDKTKWQKDLPLCTSGEIISEGTNVLLMRYLALKNFHGNLSFQSITIEGQLTTCNYRCTEARNTKLNDRVIDVYTIERRIHEECGLVRDTKTHMTRSGFILRHDWLEVPYLLKINPLIDPNEIHCEKSRFKPPLKSRWSDDVQMLSMYLDKKTCKMAQQVEYLTDHPEIKQLISDYTQKLLAVKPINVLPFTIQHFVAFAKNPDPSKIGDPVESNVEITSQLSKNKPRRVCSICGVCFDCSMWSEQPAINSECDYEAESLHCYQPPEQKTSEYSLCSVFTKCPSDASCVRKFSGTSNATRTSSGDSEAYKSVTRRENSPCSLNPECEKTCDGCKPLREPCAIHKACPECAGCHKVCSEISVCPNCKKCNIEILPEVEFNGCGRSGAEIIRSDVNPCRK